MAEAFCPLNKTCVSQYIKEINVGLLGLRHTCVGAPRSQPAQAPFPAPQALFSILLRILSQGVWVFLEISLKKSEMYANFSVSLIYYGPVTQYLKLLEAFC